MDKQKAETLVRILDTLLSGKLLVVATTGISEGEIDVRVGQKFKEAYIVDHKGGGCVVAVVDSYGVMTGADTWIIDPNQRSVSCKVKNIYGRIITTVWRLSDNDEEACRAFSEAREEYINA